MDIHHIKNRRNIGIRRRCTLAGLTGILFFSPTWGSPETVSTSTYLSSNMMGGGMGWGGMFLGPIFISLIIILIIGLPLFFLKVSSSNTFFKRDSDLSQTPLEILKKRYARGEIDKNEYQERKSELDK